MEANPSTQLNPPTVEAVVRRSEIASRILAGLCANQSVIAHNHNCGWSLVNCTDADLAGYAVSLADALMAALAASTPNPGVHHSGGASTTVGGATSCSGSE